MKKNLSSKPKNWKPTRSQTVGIVWLSVALLLIVVVAIFLRQGNVNGAKTDATLPHEVQNLALSEDTLYRSRRTQPSPSASANRGFRQPSAYPGDAQPSTGATQNSPSAAAEPPHFAAPYKREALVVDLNEADTLTLQLLRGIGPARARAIVRYRERLGGFVAADQLLEVWGIDAALLADLLPMLRVDASAVHPLLVNSASLKQLLRHPYIGHYQARDLVRLREAGVSFSSIDDLRAVPSFDDSTLRRLAPYLSFALAASDTTAEK